jgi:tRNA pseudouridine55 synthase
MAHYGWPTLDGLVLLDKPRGLSSHSATSRARKLCGAARAGHVGSLDPLATGMLPICLGEATKIAGLVASHDKSYRFTLLLGVRTATGDAEGDVVERLPVPRLDLTIINQVLAGMAGPQTQIPPMFSAIKQGGQPLYRLARKGQTVEREPRNIRIEQLQCTQLTDSVLEFFVSCSKGTYVRVLGEDIARALGTCGHLIALRRDWVEPFQGLRMWKLEDIAAALEANDRDFLLATSTALPLMPRLTLNVEEARRLLQGQTISRLRAAAGTCWLQDEAGLGLGLGHVESLASDSGAIVRPQRMFTQPLP